MQLKRNQGLNMFNLDFILFHRGYTCLTRNPVVLLPRSLRGRVGVRVKWCNLKQVGVARHQVTFFCLVLAESNQSKRQPLPWPATPLRYSTNQMAMELAALKQTSPKTPDLSALLGMAAGD